MNTEQRSPFAQVLRRLRLAAGLSQEQLAERARVSLDAVGALERGTRRAPYRETVDMLALAMNASDAERAELHTAARRPRKLPGTPLPAAPSGTADALPRDLTQLRGRDAALADLEALADRRLITICGAGGIGKTRVAVALCRRIAPDRTWFVPLEAIASDDLVAANAARGVGAVLQDEDAIGATVAALRERSGTLLLDNCEHVTEGARRLVDAILASCPGVRIVATSRRPLGSAQETVYRLASLDVPPPGTVRTAADALAYGSIALFVDRATAANVAFRFTDADVDRVAEISSRLDGIPLALELAAARARVLSLARLAAHLDDRFRLLTGGDAGAIPRRRTLSALIDWSYDLLAPAERSFLDRASVFAGGFDLDAARAVCGDANDDVLDVLDRVAALVDHSLLVAETGDDRERYRMLESTRAYARDRLDADGEATMAAHRHARHFADVARAADEAWGTSDAREWVPAMERETENFRRALDWTISERNDASLGGRLAGDLERFWLSAGFEVEGRARVRQALAAIDEAGEPAVAARLQRTLSWLLQGSGKYDAATRAVELYARIPDEAGLADSLRQQAIGASQIGRNDVARGANERALEIFRRIGNARGLANCLDAAGALARQTDDFDAARRFFGEALELFRAAGNLGGTGSVLQGLSELAFATGDVRGALALITEARTFRRSGKAGSTVATDDVLAAAYTALAGDVAGSLALVERGIDAARSVRNEALVATGLLCAAMIGARIHDLERAVRLHGCARAIQQRLQLVPDAFEARLAGLYAEALGDGIERERIVDLEAEGAAWSEASAVSEVTRIVVPAVLE
jgi:predicted ATPase/DNA-binding XRE family transcriptional regulator